MASLMLTRVFPFFTPLLNQVSAGLWLAGLARAPYTRKKI